MFNSEEPDTHTVFLPNLSTAPFSVVTMLLFLKVDKDMIGYRMQDT